MIGWALLSRDQVNRAEAALKPEDQGVLDEIGLLALHQAFADRFFPGTSVLHTHLRYALFVPWAMERSAGDADQLEANEILVAKQLARPWDKKFSRPLGIIGVESLPYAPSQAPSRSYWGALSAWNIVRPDLPARSRAAVLRLLKNHASRRSQARHVDGESLDDAEVSPFADLPPEPEGWLREKAPLDFSIRPVERMFFRRQWIGLRQGNREDAHELSLLAQLAAVKYTTLHGVVKDPKILPWDGGITNFANAEEKKALRLARQAASMACIARGIYAALLERACNQDGLSKARTFRDLLDQARIEHAELAGALDFGALREFVSLPSGLVSLLEETQNWLAKAGSSPEPLFDTYCKAEWDRKKGRARLLRTDGGKKRRAEWRPEEHPEPQPLHYRWGNVRSLLEEYSDGAQ